MDEIAQRIAATTAALEWACMENKLWVSGDGRVHEAAAAKLLGWKADTLARKRRQGIGPRHYMVGGRPTYRLHDLAMFVEQRRIEADFNG